jgi:hypothetical protein
MIDVKAVVEVPNDRVSRGNPGRERPYAARGIGRRIKCGDRPIVSPDEDAIITANGVSRDGLKVGSGDYALQAGIKVLAKGERRKGRGVTGRIK